ncbi:TPA: helix-turn-helix domain-containing protein [Raoultella planticola]
MSSPLQVFSDLSEKLHYNLADLPLYVRKDELSRYGYAAPCHWHHDLEFIFIITGEMDFFINGNIVTITASNGVFINSKRLHYGFSTQHKDCTFIALVISPTLFPEGSHLLKKYFEKKFGASADDFILLNNGVAWQSAALERVVNIYNAMRRVNVNPLSVLAELFCLCSETAEHIQETGGAGVDSHRYMLVWDMTEYIHRHYDKKITLNEIAAAGAVCRSRCCELFKEHLKQTPNAYLIRFRIAKSGEMLRETSRTIAEIALICGFQSASYFSYLFRKETGMTPNDYRQKGSLLIQGQGMAESGKRLLI